METIKLNITSKRECEDCTSCCEGWLSGSVNGRSFYPGKPCHFARPGEGCTVYEDRPQDPCISFNCLWKTDMDVPEWMKPSLSKTILTYRLTKFNKIKYLALVPAGADITTEVLSWFITWTAERGENIVWYLKNGSIQFLGDPDFCEEMVRQSNG